MIKATPELLLKAYENGVFPMSAHRWAQGFYWEDPKKRGILPLDGFHVSRSLAKLIRRNPYYIRVNTAFRDVVQGCAEPAPDRMGTWISFQIEDLYCELHALGHAHCVEVWDDYQLVGGIYGVARGAAFFGESMFSRVDNASKIALVYLVARLKAGGFRLLDTQNVTNHLMTFGGIEIPRAQYHRLLLDALAGEADFFRLPQGADGARALQSLTQTS
jgi:leucyl/phenylalanyl-tRNA--protein transferase